MDDSSVTDSDGSNMHSSVASVLGIKGPLRFRPHGLTQKAHVILRRVTASDDSNEDGEVNRVVRFSLFAHKRIEVKPGKEILLTVASPDGQFTDQPVVLEGDILCAENISEKENNTQVAKEEEVFTPATGGVIPPKMRRAWTKKTEDVNHVNHVIQQPATTHSSIGIQVEPKYASISIQARPSYTSTSSQTYIKYMSACAQVDPVLTRQVSSAVQTLDPHRYMNLDVQTHGLITDISSQREVASLRDIEDQKADRSLSPMELDSPVHSPIFSPTDVPDLIKRLSLSPQLSLSPRYSPATPTSSIASSSGVQDMQMSPIDLRSSSNTTSFQSDISHLKPSSLSNACDKGVELPIKLSQVTPDNPEDTPVSPSMIDNQHSASQITPRAVPTNVDTRLSPTQPGKQKIRNPFVSAGFMTEFIGTMNGLTAQEKVEMASKLAETESETLPVPAPQLPPPSASLPVLGLSEPKSIVNHSMVGTRQQIATTSSTSLQPSQPLRVLSQRTKSPPSKPLFISQNAVASSSKLDLEKTSALPHPSQPVIPSGPRSLVGLSSRAQEKSPALSGNRSSGLSTIKRLSPPPEPKSLAYIPTGPSSNPLNIRPSSNVLLRSSAQKAPPTAPKILTAPTAKKRVVVGTGWPLVKVTNGVGATSISTHTPPPPPPSGPSQVPPVSNLSNFLSYSSPSPPPSTPAPSTTSVNKWKPVNSDILAGQATPNIGSFDMPSQSGSMGIEEKPKKEKKKKERQKKESSVTDSPKSQGVSCTERSDKSLQSMSLKDRLAPNSTSLPHLPLTPVPPLEMATGHNLRNRISDASSPSLAGTNRSINEYHNEANPLSLPTYPLTPNTRKPSLPLPQLLPIVPRSLNHPLPPKPVLALSNVPSRGIKRERPPSPDLSVDPIRRSRRTFRWPTVDSNYSIGLKGEGELGVRNISFSSDGNYFALSCADRTIRIWNNRERVEIARLSHNSPVIAVSWMDGDSGVVSLAEDGLVSKWTRSGQNHWQWAKVLDAGNDRRSEDDQACLAYVRDRIAVSFPRIGVKVWVWLKGTWQPQRSILRQNVSAIRFVEDGAALVGGTRDGVLWHCEIPNGTLRAYAFLKSKINSLDLNPTESHVLVGQVGGCARLVGIRRPDNKGSVEQSYSCTETEARPNGGFGALFATQGQAILFGSVEGCVLVWDRKKGAIVYGLEHEEGDLIQAVASFDGVTSRDGCLITGTKAGHLAWWSQPVAAPQSDDAHKRVKVE